MTQLDLKEGVDSLELGILDTSVISNTEHQQSWRLDVDPCQL